MFERKLIRALGLLVALFFGSAQAQNSTPFLAGGDISTLSWMEAAGARYSDRNGKDGDALKILKAAGYNVVRIRLYERTGPGTGADGWYWPAGSMDLPDVLALSRRATALGLKIQLTLHYSDFWTNSKTQNLPYKWAQHLETLPDDESRMAALIQLVSKRTRVVMQAMQKQGTPPDSVALGNEIEHGMLYPYGRATPENWPRLGALLKAGYDAVKAVQPSAQVVLHLDGGGDEAKYRDWFDQARANGVQWDVIGSSYYPFWTGKTVEEMAAFSTAITQRYNCDLLVMETGFNWSPTQPNGWPGQLSNNGPYPATMSSPEGQRDFIADLFSKLRKVRRVLGVLYWDPIMIETPGVGWALRDGTAQPGPNVVSNTTLFDFKGKALPVLDIWKDYTK